LLILLLHLVVTKKNTKRLGQDDVAKPEHKVVCVPGNIVFHLALNENDWHIDHHENERNEVDH